MKPKPLLLLLIGILLLGDNVFASDYDFIVDEIGYKIIDMEDPSVEMCSYIITDIPETLVLPDFVEYQGVQFAIKSLGKRLFNNMGGGSTTGFKTIVLPKQIKSIGEGCFSWNTNLERVDFPSTLEYIGVNAFAVCSNLKDFTLPYNLKKIDTYGMDGIGSTSLVIDCENLELGHECFAMNSNLEYLHVNGVELISDGAFMLCEELKKIILDSSVSSVYAASFYDCKPDILILKSEKEVTIQGSHYEKGGHGTIITENPFVNGDDNTSYPVYVLSVPEGMSQYYTEKMLDWRFQYIQEFSNEQDIANSGHVFSYTDGNNYMITLNGSKNTVGLYSLKSEESDVIYIPDCVDFNGVNFKVNSINGNFFRTQNVKDIYVSSLTPFELNTYSFSPLTYLTATLHVPIGSLDVYRNVEGWKAFKTIKEEDFKEPVFPESITIDQSQVALKINEITHLKAIISPTNATFNNIQWSTSNAAIATVDNEGKVTAISVGETTITATCGDKSATCKVTVNPILAESITLDKTELTMTIGETEKLTATVRPEDVTDNTVTWSTSDASIATVDNEGNVKAISVGEATITATCGDKSATCKVTVNPILAESITLDKTELSLTIGASEKLTATVLPEDVTDKTVTWSTSDAAIATVGTEGNVTAVSVGEATITSTCGDKSATCKVTVNPILAESITLDKTELTLTIGASEKLTATVLPEDVTDKTVTWSTSVAAIATVDNEGKVTAVSIGEATITATCGDKSATCKVTVNPILAESITLDKTELTLTIGATEKLTATLLPEDVTDKTVTWSTSDASIATVDAEGNVKAISVGEATITATCGDKSATCKVTVNPILAESITLDKTELTLTIGASEKLTAIVLPEEVTDKTVTWSTSDAAIATVDTEGNVTAISVGEATITATCGDRTATCKVTVNPILAASITLDKTELTLTIGASEKLTATVLPEDVTDKTVTWSTSDAAIATVDTEGNVTAISVGEAVITATCGEISTSCRVIVEKISGIVFVSADDINIVVNGNELTIKGATSEDKVTIGRQDGAVIYSGNNRESYTLVRGLYIILVNDATYKVVIN